MTAEATSGEWLERRIAQARALKRGNQSLSQAEEDRILLADEIERLGAVIHRIAHVGTGELTLTECRKLASDSIQEKHVAEGLQHLLLTTGNPAVAAEAVGILRKLREFLKQRFELIVAGDAVRFRFEQGGSEAAMLFQLLERADTLLGLVPESGPLGEGESSLEREGARFTSCRKNQVSSAPL